MAEIILNEREWAEDMIQQHKLGHKPFDTLGRLARYYYSEGYRKPAIGRMLEEHLLRCDPSVNLVSWQLIIDECVKQCDKRSLINIPGIHITKSEIDKLTEIKGVMKQRIMFTLLCLAKYGNAIRAKNNGWVNIDQRDIFSLANITLSVKRRTLLLNELWQDGYISYSNMVSNVNMRVEIINDDSEPLLLINDFRNLGYQFMYFMFGNKSYMPCQICNLIVRRYSNRQKYCRCCAAAIDNAA